MPRARCIASIRCGSSSIAASSRRRRDNPSGCNAKLFSWVEVTVGAGTNGAATAVKLQHRVRAGQTTTGEGSTALGFYNVQQGDAPYFKSLARHYAMSDNFHQSVNGGTGANHIMFGHGDAIWFSDGNGNPAVPPNGKEVYTSCLHAANPNPVRIRMPVLSARSRIPIRPPGTNNWYTEDGYGESYNAGYPPAIYG